MKQSPTEDWHTICNMRSTLLQLQYLYCSVSEQLEQQAKHFDLIHKDRLLQYSSLHSSHHELSQRNFKTLLIAKLE
jgi:hypothetical protein